MFQSDPILFTLSKMVLALPDDRFRLMPLVEV
jgi:hypothetical protein